MSRVLAYTSPARGHLYPLAPILLELRDRGHEVTVRTLAGGVEVMRSQGFDAASIDPRVEALTLEDWRGRTIRDRLARSVATFAARAPYDASDLDRALDAVQPDVLLVDVNSWGALTVAEQWGGPWAAVCPYPLALPSPDVPPYGPGLRPATGALGRARDRALRPLLHSTLERTMLPPLNQLRGKAGVAPLETFDALFTRPPLLVYLTAEPFEYVRGDWPANVLMVGPCAWEPPMQVPGWLADVQGPLVLVTTSSERQDDLRLVGTALEALADEPVHVVATVPSQELASLSIPPNAHVEAFVPHTAVLERATCAVTHGGMGATQKALAHGVPVCAVPFGRDQYEVARRVEVARAGTRLPAPRLSPPRLREAVRQASRCRQGAEQVARGFAAAGGPAAAADAVEQRLLGGRVSRRPAG